MTRTLTYRIHDVAPYINWSYFFHAWGFPPRFSNVSRIQGCDVCRAVWLAGFPEPERAQAAEAMQLLKDARRMLDHLDKDFHTHARFGLYPAYADGDDLILADPEKAGRKTRLPLLRQQHAATPGTPNLCLADFVRPATQGIADTVGVFAATVDAGMEHLYEDGAYADDFKHLLAQTLADRLAEATSEWLHYQVRTRLWGYHPHEPFDPDKLRRGQYPGIRPAVGYPALPDQSLIFDLDRLLHLGGIGIALTESGAMHPASSVCGLYLSHPQARYFLVGPVDAAQLADYARRRGRTPDEMSRWLACGNAEG